MVKEDTEKAAEERVDLEADSLSRRVYIWRQLSPPGGDPKSLLQSTILTKARPTMTWNQVQVCLPLTTTQCISLSEIFLSPSFLEPLTNAYPFGPAVDRIQSNSLRSFFLVASRIQVASHLGQSVTGHAEWANGTMWLRPTWHRLFTLNLGR